MGDSNDWLRTSSGATFAMPERNSIADLVASRALLEAVYVDYGIPDGVVVDGLETVAASLSGELVRPLDADRSEMILGIHGGGWCSGSPAIDRPWNCWLAEQGYAVWAPRYGLAPERPFPGAVYDCATALLAADSFAKDRNISLHLYGYSAGANLLLAALTLLERSGKGIHGHRVMFAYGIFDWTLLQTDPSGRGRTVELWNEAYLGPFPSYWHRHELVSPAQAPDVLNRSDVLLVCGGRDVLLSQTTNFHDSLISLGVRSELLVGESLRHSFLKDFDSDEAAFMREAILAWTRR